MVKTWGRIMQLATTCHRVESPSSNMYLSLNTFKYFLNVVTKLSDFVSLDAQIGGLQIFSEH